MKTYQDLLEAKRLNNIERFILTAINEHKMSKAYRNAVIAERYDIGDTDIVSYQKFLYNTFGEKFPDKYSANNKIPSNMFGQLVTQETAYILGNGVLLEDTELYKKVGNKIDNDIYKVLRLAYLQGKSYLFVSENYNIPFELTEFVPLYDENNGQLMAGIRFYKLDTQLPLNVWLYEIDGETYYRKKYNSNNLEIVTEKTAYKTIYRGNKADGLQAVDFQNYSTLPIVELKANQYSLSEIIKVKSKIDAYDFTLSGLQNDIDENAFVYWVIKNNGGMDEEDLAQFKQSLRTSKVASADSDDIEHYTSDIPVEARRTMLEKLKSDIYNSMACVDMSTLSSGAVNELQINAMYSAMDNKAKETEMHLKPFIMNILSIKGYNVSEESISFEYNKLQSEQEKASVTNMKVSYIMQTANEVDDITVLEALKKIVPEYQNLDIQKALDGKDIDEDMTEPVANQNEITIEENGE